MRGIVLGSVAAIFLAALLNRPTEADTTADQKTLMTLCTGQDTPAHCKCISTTLKGKDLHFYAKAASIRASKVSPSVQREEVQRAAREWVGSDDPQQVRPKMAEMDRLVRDTCGAH